MAGKIHNKPDEMGFPHIAGYDVSRLGPEDESILQLLCEKCSDYFEVAEGGKAPADAAFEILTEMPPNKGYEDKFVLGIFEQNSGLIAVVDLVRDYPEKGEWIIGLLMIDPAARSQGLGRKIHDGLAGWASAEGAEKLRIGVVEDNRKAYAFWSKLGYMDLEKVVREIGSTQKTVIVMNYFFAS